MTLCSRRTRPDELDRLDLSTLEWAYSGAEPVRLETIEEFTSVFSPYGFRKKAWYPCYGLAGSNPFCFGRNKGCPAGRVHSFFVRPRTASGNYNVSRRGRPPISRFGDAVKPEEVIIVNPMTTTPCTEAEVGEIWVSGPHIAEGTGIIKKQQREPSRRQSAVVKMAHFFRTGDLGFVKDGELFITGRIKDLIILRGRNYYPQDIELAAWQSHGSLRRGRAAAFTHRQFRGTKTHCSPRKLSGIVEE